jgi:hypothetical protein
MEIDREVAISYTISRDAADRGASALGRAVAKSAQPEHCLPEISGWLTLGFRRRRRSIASSPAVSCTVSFTSSVA